MIDTIYLVAGGIGLLIVGLGLGFWAAQLRNSKQAAKAEDVQKEFDDYRKDVTEHFGRTAEHFQAIGQQYRELYEHMAIGADALCDQQEMDEKLSFTPTALIEPMVDQVTSPADTTPPPRDYADDDVPGQVDDDATSEVEVTAADPVAANDDEATADESAAAEPPADQIEDAEPAVKAEDTADDSQRTYH